MPEQMLSNLDKYSRKTAQPLFILATFYLLFFALIIHWPLFFDKIKELSKPMPDFLWEGLLLCWIPFLFDAAIYVYYNFRKLNLLRLFSIIIFPPFRIMYPAWNSSHYIWFPRLGWQYKNKPLAALLEKRFDTPMLVIALLILPAIVIEILFSKQVDESDILQNLLYFSVIFTWLAFALEFIIKIAVAPRKLQYCKANIINIAIILLPIFAFMRSLRVIRAATPFLKHGKLLKVAKTMRLRGLAVKFIKGLMALSIIQRLAKKFTRPKNLKQLYQLHEDHQEELEELEEKMQELQLKLMDIKDQITALEMDDEKNKS